MTEELRRALPSVVFPVDVSDGQFCELLVGDVIEARDVDSVHLADRRFVSDAECPYAAVLAEIVEVLPGIEQILGQFRFTRQQAEAFGSRNCGPEACPPADGAVAAISALRQIQVGFECDGAAMTAAMIGFQHGGGNQVLIAPFLAAMPRTVEGRQ